MRAKINGIISTKEAEELLEVQWRSRFNKHDFRLPVMEKLLEKCSKYIGECKLEKPSYWSIETRSKEHPWHLDTGTNSHMLWCDYGISILLTPPQDDKGGLFKYKDPNEEYKQSEHYLNAIVHSSDQWHEREESSNGRTVLLIFLAKED